MSKTILIMAGGTGGHIFPALAVADELKKSGVNLHWLGSNHGMENSIIPQHNIPLHAVSAVGLRGKNMFSLLKAPFLLSVAFLQTLRVFISVRPDCVLGMGGFASGIGGVIARLLRIPLVIHEQNSIAGTTNKLLTKIASKTFQAFNGALDGATTCGNPVLLKPKKSKTGNKKLNLLVVGGSLGAKPINDIASQLDANINIFHQTGKQHFDAVSAKHHKKGAKIVAFIDDMAAAYAWADVVLCRAGAMTISELMIAAKPSILIPLPHAIDNHQFHNAKILASQQAGILIEQKDFTLEKLQQTLLELDKPTLEKMAINAKQLAKPKAAKLISDYLLSIN